MVSLLPSTPPSSLQKVSPRSIGQGDPLNYLRQINNRLEIEASSIAPADVSGGARAFLLDQGLGGREPERQDRYLCTRWEAHRVVRFADKDFVIMNQALSQPDETGRWVSYPSLTWQGIAVECSAKGYTFSRFEDALPMPATLQVGIGPVVLGPTSEALNPELYYVELAGPSVAEALKQAYLKLFTPGLLATLSVDGGGCKAPFDPTPNRRWMLENVSFDIQRGSTGEAMDVYPGQIDERGPAAMVEGCAGRIGPWGSSIRKVKVDDQWRDALPPKTGVGRIGGGFNVMRPLPEPFED